MAIRYTISAPIFIQKPASTKRPVTRLLVKANNHIAATSTSLQSGSSLRIKVFEDSSEGIVCYRDANGEIICEGYDEGPRFQKQQISRFACNSRDSEIVDLLDRWLQIVDGGGFVSQGGNVVNKHTEINCKPSTRHGLE